MQGSKLSAVGLKTPERLYLDPVQGVLIPVAGVWWEPGCGVPVSFAGIEGSLDSEQVVAGIEEVSVGFSSLQSPSPSAGFVGFV